MTSAKKTPCVRCIVSGTEDYVVIVATYPGNVVESHANYKQKHIGFFAEDPANDPPELVPLRPMRDVMYETLVKLAAMKAPEGTTT